VIRYDHRDTGRSVTCEPGRPGYLRVLGGGVRPFDEAGMRDFVRRDVARSRNVAARQNHGLIPADERQRAPLSSIAVPALVIHGTADPMFPAGHGQALAREIPGARLLWLQDAGHGVERPDWEVIVRAILDHTAAA
jgi:pimeloyl-ACP methyl ester carboxylesterase